MKKPRKRLDRRAFWKWAAPPVLGLVILAILHRSGAAHSFGAVNTMAFVRLVLIVLLAMPLARRFRDIGWRAWIGPTILVVTMLGPPFLVAGYVVATDDSDILEWAPMVGEISEFVSLVLLIVAGSMPGKTARERNIEAVQVFE